MKKRVSIDFQPIGCRVRVEAGTALLTAAQQAGVQLVALCGGHGRCEGCKVRLVTGQVTPPNLLEQEALQKSGLAAGFRLACQTEALGDVKVDIPVETLSTAQRLQMEGMAGDVHPDPLVVPREVELPPASLRDLRSDATRLSEVASAGGSPISLAFSVLQSLSPQIREQEWSARLALRHQEVVAVLPQGSPLLGLAVDIGTTKMAAYLLNLEDGRTLAKAGTMNPQVGYGEDVVSRICHTEEHADGRKVLQEKVIDAINQTTADLCVQTGASPDQIVDMVVVGNTAMHHLFAGLPVKQLGLAPYVPAVSQPLDLRARELGLRAAPGAYVHLPANIAGYVGADHVAVLLSTDLWRTKKTVLALDIGTNTEVTLAHNGRLLTCSCASGPAFEGAHIEHGMRAAPGAIERLRIEGNQVQVQTIDGQAPVGICGSGILDAAAQMLEHGILNRSGKLEDSHPLIRQFENQSAMLLVDGGRTGHGRDIVVTRHDIHEIQLAKAAIRTGQEVLLREAGISHEAIDDLIIAGAFGTYLDVASAVRIGMFPELPGHRYHQIGNAAGSGARQMLLSATKRRAAARIPQRVEYVELTTYPHFSEMFMRALYF